MPISSIFLIILSALIAVALAWLHYFYKAKIGSQYLFLVSFLRALSIFLILILLINPKIKSTQYFTEKPNLIIAVDNSASIDHFGSSEEVMDFVNEIQNNAEIEERFNVASFAFGDQVRKTSDFSFSEERTNIHEVFHTLKDLYVDANSPILLISDGNQTYGPDYLSGAQSFQNQVYPIIVGDTTKYPDLSLVRINVNKHSLLNNEFPVEMIVNYSGDDSVNTKLQISLGDKVLYSQALSLNENKNSVVVETSLPASKIGVSSYKAEILPLSQEENLFNNVKNFAVEVIDERSSILILTEVIHPDLAALKKSIESNEQREVVIRQITSSAENMEDYDLIILYQPSENFASVTQELKEQNRNYWLITGPETDWSFVNGIQDHFQKQLSGQVEEYFPNLNPDFHPFQIDDLGFSNFPPLVDIFGNIEGGNSSEIILFQQIQGLPTEAPLLATVADGEYRKAFLFGANIWQWRAQVYLQTGSFEEFDNLVGKLVQYLASNQRRERLHLHYENIYNANEEIVISADFFDENYNFDPRAELFLELQKEEDENQLVPFALSTNRYEASLNGITASDYNFRVVVEGENLSRTGSFTVVEHDLEKQFSSANLNALSALAEMRGGILYDLSNIDNLVEELMADKSYIPVQKSRQKNVSLIDWYYLLAFALLSLSMEWFIRKYHGLI